MILKVMALLRTLFLLFLLGYTLARALPWQVGLPVASSAAYDTCRASLAASTKAIWMALAWIAFEAAVGWWLATRPPKLAVKDVPKAGGEPPFAPPAR